MKLKRLFTLLTEEFGIVGPAEIVELRACGKKKFAVVNWPIGIDKRDADRRMEAKHKLVPVPRGVVGPYASAYRVL